MEEISSENYERMRAGKERLRTTGIKEDRGECISTRK